MVGCSQKIGALDGEAPQLMKVKSVPEPTCSSENPKHTLHQV